MKINIGIKNYIIVHRCEILQIEFNLTLIARALSNI